MSKKIGYIFNLTTTMRNYSKSNTPYYEDAIDTVKRIKDHKRFPNIKAKDIYEVMSTKVVPSIVTRYAFDWSNIWKNLNFKYMNFTERNIMYKFIYEILPTNKRLNQIRVAQSPLCQECDMEDTNSHKFYFCSKVQECVSWLRKVIYYICGIKVNSMLKILYLDIPKIEKRNMNSLCIIVSCYITSVWYNRENMEFIKNIVKACLIKEQRFHKRLIGGKAKKVFSENYCNLDMRILNSF